MTETIPAEVIEKMVKEFVIASMAIDLPRENAERWWRDNCEDVYDAFQQNKETAICAALKAAEAAGWVMVPVEATEKMMGGLDEPFARLSRLYRAMIAARPKVP